jgi:hypothetical protein
MWSDRGRVSTMENTTTTINTQTQDFNQATQAGTDADMTQPSQLKVVTEINKITLLRIFSENGQWQVIGQTKSTNKVVFVRNNVT